MGIYEKLNVPTIINAAGTFTELGGSLMPSDVVQAWCEASRHFVDMRTLQDRVGARIAELLEVEAAMVTAGAASSLLLGTAAAITQRDHDYPDPHSSRPVSAPYQVLRPRAHRDLYDRQVLLADVELVEVETAAEVEAAISDRTILMLAYNVHASSGALTHEHWIALAQRHGVPTLLDAAADVPPVDHFRRYLQQGYDMVAFSGGKAIRGPQDTGLLVGRRELIDAAKRNASPNEGVVGRVAKVSKEDLVACYVAIERFVSHDADQIHHDCQRRLEFVVEILREIPPIATRWITPSPANHFPHLIVDWDRNVVAITPQEVQRALRSGTPAIMTGRVAHTGTDGLLISAINLTDAESTVVAHRLKAILVSSFV
jgi:L-seryl-tRNA(Ser) seleniumtransferase